MCAGPRLRSILSNSNLHILFLAQGLGRWEQNDRPPCARMAPLLERLGLLLGGLGPEVGVEDGGEVALAEGGDDADDGLALVLGPRRELLRGPYGRARRDTAPGRFVIIIISAPNENSQKASISVNVLAAGSQDRICVNEHQN